MTHTAELEALFCQANEGVSREAIVRQELLKQEWLAVSRGIFGQPMQPDPVPSSQALPSS